MRREIPAHLEGALIIDRHTFAARHIVGQQASEATRTVNVGGEWSPAQHAKAVR